MHLPRLREAHAHLPMLGEELSRLNLASCCSVEECLALLSREAARTPRGHWLIAVGVRTEAWPIVRWPHMRELDDACPHMPCVLMSFDHHALAVNTAAFKACGFTTSSANPPGGLIVRDDAGPTGLLLESAAMAVRAAIPPVSDDVRREQVLAAVRHLADLGFVEIHDLLAPAWLGPVLATLHDQGELISSDGSPLRVDLFTPMNEFDAAVATRSRWERPTLKLAGGKLFADGTLNSKTAWMLSPFASGMPDHPCGTPLLSVQDIARDLERCANARGTLAVHAIGDGAVRACLDAAEHIGPAAPPRTLRIEHAEIIDDADISRFRRLGVIASVQPCHLLYDIEVLERQLPHRLDRVMPWRDLVQSGLQPGVDLLFGSDVPIVPADPEDSILAATRRTRRDSTRPIAPNQALSRPESLACFAPTA